MPYLQNSSNTETIVGIQFGVFSPDEVTRRSVVEVLTHDTREGTIGGLLKTVSSVGLVVLTTIIAQVILVTISWLAQYTISSSSNL